MRSEASFCVNPALLRKREKRLPKSMGRLFATFVEIANNRRLEPFSPPLPFCKTTSAPRQFRNDGSVRF